MTDQDKAELEEIREAISYLSPLVAYKSELKFLMDQVDGLVRENEQLLFLLDATKKTFNVNHFGKCAVSRKLPCSCGRDNWIILRNELLDK